jgi:hypothetical protein
MSQKGEEHLEAFLLFWGVISAQLKSAVVVWERKRGTSGLVLLPRRMRGASAPVGNPLVINRLRKCI